LRTDRYSDRQRTEDQGAGDKGGSNFQSKKPPSI
jgi:hypothetical protein